MTYDDMDMLTLRDWIDINKLDLDILICNPSAIHMTEKYINETNITLLFQTEVYNSKMTELIDTFFKITDEYIDWTAISACPNAINIIKQYPDKIILSFLAFNPHDDALDIVESRITELNHIGWGYLLEYNTNNKKTASIIEKHIKLIPLTVGLYVEDNVIITTHDSMFSVACHNPYIIHLISKKINYSTFDDPIQNHAIAQTQLISPKYISLNSNAMHILKKYPSLICYNTLGGNANYKALEMVEQNLDQITDYDFLLSNPNAMYIINKHINELDKWEKSPCWNILSSNPAAIYLLEKYQNKINYDNLSANTNIFTYNYNKIKTLKKDINHVIIAEMYRPSRIAKFLETNQNPDEYLE